MSVILPNTPPYVCSECGRSYERGAQVARNADRAVCFDCGGYSVLDRSAPPPPAAEAAPIDAEPSPRGAP